MAKTSIIINSTSNQGKSLQKTLTDVNPEATNEELATFGQRLTAITTNVYGNTTRIDKINCDAETTVVKPTPTFSVDITSVATSWLTESDFLNVIVTYSGDGILFFKDFSVDEPGIAVMKKDSGSNKSFSIYGSKKLGTTTVPCTFKVGFTETDNYKAVETTITITA